MFPPIVDHLWLYISFSSLPLCHDRSTAFDAMLRFRKLIELSHQEDICMDPCQEIHLQVWQNNLLCFVSSFFALNDQKIGYSSDEPSRLGGNYDQGVLYIVFKQKIQVTTTRYGLFFQKRNENGKKNYGQFFRPSYPFLTMVAEIGGFLGLILGFSLMHLIQIMKRAAQRKKN